MAHPLAMVTVSVTFPPLLRSVQPDARYDDATLKVSVPFPLAPRFLKLTVKTRALIAEAAFTTGPPLAVAPFCTP
jgi:hypothetical protein